MPAQSSGAAPAGSSFGEMFRTKASVHHDVVGVAAIGRLPRMLVGRVVGKCHAPEAELLLAGLTVFAGAVRIDHAADARHVASLELLDILTDLGYTPDDFVTGHDTGIRLPSPPPTHCVRCEYRSGRCRSTESRSPRLSVRGRGVQIERCEWRFWRFERHIHAGWIHRTVISSYDCDLGIAGPIRGRTRTNPIGLTTRRLDAAFRQFHPRCELPGQRRL